MGGVSLSAVLSTTCFGRRTVGWTRSIIRVELTAHLLLDVKTLAGAFSLHSQECLFLFGSFRALTIHADLQSHTNAFQILDQSGQFHVFAPLQL